MKWRAYPKYKDSGIEWLGNIPTHWQVNRLKYGASRINEKVDGRGSDLPYTGLEHIESWTGRLLAGEETPTSEGQSSRFEPGDVLFGKLRPYLAKVLRATADGICTGELLVLRPNQVTQDYLFNYMLARDFVAIVDSSTYGAKMPRANWEFIGNLPMLLPPKDEQRAIAAFLDRETERLDALIARKERQIELLQEKRAALISHAVTKGLDPNAPMKDSGVEWLGEIPAHWTTDRLKWTITDCRNGIWGAEPDGVHDIICVRVADFDRVQFKTLIDEPTMRAVTASQRRGRVLEQGNLLLEKSGGGDLQPVGAVMLYDHDAKAVCSNFVARMSVAPDWSSRFLVYLHAHLYAGRVNTRSIKQTTGIQNIDSMAYLNERVTYPTLTEQRAIAAFLNCETKQLDALVKKVQDSIDKLREYRTALISAAVTGKIDIRQVGHDGL